jgi:hypothetical protein
MKKILILIFAIINLCLSACEHNQNSSLKYDKNLCMENENLLISFAENNGAKTVSVSISKDQSDYIVFRIGTTDKIEFEFPIDKNDSWNQFMYSYYFRGGGIANEGVDLNNLSFRCGDNIYKLYQEYDSMSSSTNVGIEITDTVKNDIIDIKGLSDSIEGSLTPLRFNEKINIEEI